MNLISGKKTIATTGTPLQLLTTNQAVKHLIITPYSGNTGVVAVGGSAATTIALATLGSQQGVVMIKGANPIELFDVDLNQVWIDASVSGEGVSWTAQY